MTVRSSRVRSRRTQSKTTSAVTSEDNDELIVHVQENGALMCLLILFSMGVCMAALFVIIKHPGCFRTKSTEAGLDSFVRSSPVTSPIPKVPVPLPAQAVTETVRTEQNAPLPPPQPPALPGFPDTCTPEQLQILQQQLTSDACENSGPWLQSCSFTQATTRGCKDATEYLRKPLGAMSLKTDFRVILVGFFTVMDETPMDYLALGNHDYQKYSLETYRKAASQLECKLEEVPLQGTKAPSTHVHIMETFEERIDTAKKWIASSGLTEADGIRVDSTILKGENSISLADWVHKTYPNDVDPIHVLRVAIGSDGEFLERSKDILPRVWYLEFEYDWKEGWKDYNFKIFLQEILQKQIGMVCYFKGTRGHLWRITDCWQDHYDKKHWSYVACANTRIPEAKPIREKMEQVFLETLDKQISY